MAPVGGPAGDDRDSTPNPAAAPGLNSSITASERGLVIKDTEGRSKQYRNIFLGLLKMR